jgi:hypothetical protein
LLNLNQTIPDIIEQVAKYVIAKDFSQARELLASLDPEMMANERKSLRSTLWSSSRKPTLSGSTKAKRTGVSERLKLQVFRRDKFTCRYAHCQRKTIYIPVLKELSRIFPEFLSYHSNWKPVTDHLLYWVYSTSIEHKLSFPHGGDSTEVNLITACYCCNDVKNYLHLDDLAWQITRPSDSDWDGLESLLPALKKVNLENGRPIVKQVHP